MPRVNLVSRDKAPPEVSALYDQIFGASRDPVADPGTSTGTPGNWWTAWANTPGILKAFSAFPMAEATLDPKLRELAILRTGYARASRFVFSQHCKAARSVGFTEEQVQAIKAWQVATCYSPIERAVLAYTDALVLERGRVPEGVFDALRAELSDVEILELTYITCTYHMHAIMSRALRLEYDDVDDPTTEVPAPADASNDVMAAVDRAAE